MKLRCRHEWQFVFGVHWCRVCGCLKAKYYDGKTRISRPSWPVVRLKVDVYSKCAKCRGHKKDKHKC